MLPAGLLRNLLYSVCTSSVLVSFFVLVVLHFAFTYKTTQTSMLPAEFEPATPRSDRPQTFAIDRSATGIGYTTHAFIKRA
jgi:hypothetical protein